MSTPPTVNKPFDEKNRHIVAGDATATPIPVSITGADVTIVAAEVSLEVDLDYTDDSVTAKQDPADDWDVLVKNFPAFTGLTNAELRAADVKITLDGEIPHVIIDSMPAGGAGLTDTELRAADVKVTLDSEQVAISNFPASQAVTSATFATSAKQDLLLTELQAKADLTETQPVSLVSVPSHAVTNANLDVALSTRALESGGNLATIAGKDFATQTTLTLIKAKTDNLDVALSTRTKPSDQQHAIIDSGTITLPVGASTSAKQDTEITALGALLTELMRKANYGDINTIEGVVEVSEIQTLSTEATLLIIADSLETLNASIRRLDKTITQQVLIDQANFDLDMMRGE